MSQHRKGFLAVQNSSIGDLVTHSLRDILILTLQSDHKDLSPLRHLIRGMRTHYYLPANLVVSLNHCQLTFSHLTKKNFAML